MKLTISVDDGCSDDMRIAKLCEKLGLDVVFYWPVDLTGLGMMKGWESLSPSQEAYIARNFEIGSHTITHRYLTQISLDEATDEIFSSKEMLSNKYDQNITKFCYPRGYFTDDLKKIVREAGYESARTTVIGSISPPKDMYEEPTSVHIGCPVRPEYKGIGWYKYAIDIWEKAKTQDYKGQETVFSIFCHSWEISRYNEWKDVEKFLKIVARES